MDGPAMERIYQRLCALERENAELRERLARLEAMAHAPVDLDPLVKRAVSYAMGERRIQQQNGAE